MHTSRDELEPMVIGAYTGRSVDAAGIRIAFESMPEHFPPDESPFKGLPDDRCQCDHWGYCFKGSFRVTYLDGPEEVIREGVAALAEVCYQQTGIPVRRATVQRRLA